MGLRTTQRKRNYSARLWTHGTRIGLMCSEIISVQSLELDAISWAISGILDIYELQISAEKEIGTNPLTACGVQSIAKLSYNPSQAKG